jgi:hypothetical protein
MTGATADDFALMAQQAPSVCWHVSPSVNRESILQYGLDWDRMGEVGGIAAGAGPLRGHRFQPEAAGIFLCETHSDVEWFLTFGQHPLVDVWEVDAQELALEDGPDGWPICLQRIPASRLRLIRSDVPPQATNLPEITDDSMGSAVVYREGAQTSEDSRSDL